VETAVLIPVKAFHAAKARLAGWLSDPDRERLARWMAGRVLDAAAPLPTFVACDDEAVANWAEEHGAEVLWGPGLGLNGAVDHGVDTIAGKGAERVVIAHGDLPLPSGLGEIAALDGIVLVPDRRADGTNVLARPCAIALPASYGPASFRRHFELAMATGLPVSVRADPGLSIDLDTIADCRHPLVAPLLRDLLGERALDGTPT
jgi:2-phospho-L-lactate guanylyltransferase